MFDFSKYSKDSKFFDRTNKTVIGKMKDEFGGVIIDEFFGFKSEMNSIKKIDGKDSSTAKGVNIVTEFHEFKDVCLIKKNIRHKMKRIQAKKQKLGAYEIGKVSLSCFDDKKFVLDDGIHTLAYFSKNNGKRFKKIMIMEMYCDDRNALW